MVRIFTRCLFLCNSYDCWLPSTDIEGKVEELPHMEKPWRVSSLDLVLD